MNKGLQTLTTEQANELVLEHHGWTESIARSVARSWNLDWKLDGLDGAAMEALIFCARRFDPSRGVPFKGYARKRIHEASTEAARKSKGWRKSASNDSREQAAREISVELLNVFPELRSGELPLHEESSGDSGADTRSAIRHLLVGASLIAAHHEAAGPTQDELLDYKRMIEMVACLEPVHQSLLWKVYWEGLSMRTVASDWGTDELNVIREHKALLEFLHKSVANGKVITVPKIRPGLKQIALKLKRKIREGPFSQLIERGESHAEEAR